MPAGSVVVGRQWQMTNTDHLTACLNRKFPLTWSEFIERSGDSNQLPHSDQNIETARLKGPET